MQIKHQITAGQLIKGQSELAAAIVEMKGASKVWHKLTHTVAASAAVHAHLTGDIRPLSAALKAMPAGAKTNSMRQYFLNFAPVKWSAVAKKFKFHDTRQVKTLIEGGDNDLLTALLNTHWSSCGPVETADNFKPFNLEAALIRVLNQANKKLEEDNGEVKRETVTAVDINKVAEFIRATFPQTAKA